jgi:hypothetical protein
VTNPAITRAKVIQGECQGLKAMFGFPWLFRSQNPRQEWLEDEARSGCLNNPSAKDLVHRFDQRNSRVHPVPNTGTIAVFDANAHMITPLQIKAINAYLETLSKPNMQLAARESLENQLARQQEGFFPTKPTLEGLKGFVRNAQREASEPPKEKRKATEPLEGDAKRAAMDRL